MHHTVKDATEVHEVMTMWPKASMSDESHLGPHTVNFKKEVNKNTLLSSELLCDYPCSQLVQRLQPHAGPRHMHCLCNVQDSHAIWPKPGA